MTGRLRAFSVAGAALAGVGALVIATPTLDVTPDPATTFGASPVSTAFQLVSKDNYVGKGNSGQDDDDDDDDNENHSYSDDDDDDDDGDDDGGFGGGIGAFVTDFLANNQAEVLAVTAMIPVIYLGPIAVGNSLLATAYYNGYDGSAAGVDGVLSYVTSQIGVPPADLVQDLVLSVTSMVPQFNIGPVAVGNALLATAYFDGYDGSATGLPGVISYVTSQLGVQAAPAAVTVGAVTALSSAKQSDDAPASRTAVSVAEPVGSQDSGTTAVSAADKGVAARNAVADVDTASSTAPAAESNADSVSTARATGRGPAAAKAGVPSGQSKARSARSAAARSGGGES
jgi:hypothetical protein